MAALSSTRKRTSRVWDYFELIEVVDEKGKKIKKAACMLCDGVNLAYAGGTTNLHNHLESKHPSSVADSGKEAGKKHLTLSDYKKCPPERAKNVTVRVAEYIARDLCPISTVDGGGFQQLLHYVEPGYKVPSRPFITTTCHRLYTSMKESLLQILSSKDVHVAITTDSWTSRAVQSYLTVTAHYITSDWKLESKILQTCEMPEMHTALNIAERLRDSIKEWKIDEERVSAIVHDNASNITLAVQNLGWQSVPCFAHTLQLAVNKGLEVSQINKLASVGRKIVGHFKHSSLAMTALREKQKQLSVPQHHLIQDVATRWNSTYFMLERLHEQRWAIYAVLYDEQGTQSQYKHLYLKEDQWKLIEQLCTALKPLQVATTALCEAEIVSIALVYPVINGLLKKHLSAKPDDLAPIKAFKELVTQEIKCHFIPDSLEIVDKPALLAAAVDLHYHQLKFMSERQRPLVYAALKDKVDELTDQDVESPQASETIPQKTKDNAVTALSYILENDARESIEGQEETDDFLRIQPLSSDENCLQWWKKNAERFPTIAKVAKRYLCIPATSVPAERVFSTAGLIINEKRSSLLPENSDMLIFLNKNLPPID